MGLWDTFRAWFTGPPPLVVREQEPFSVSDAARASLAELPPGQGVHIETVSVTSAGDGDRLVRVALGEAFGPPPEALAPLPITLSDADLARLAGRVLDWADDRYVVSVHLELRARETPNPNSRLYLTDHRLALGRPVFVANSLDGAANPEVGLLRRLLAVSGVSSVLLRDNTVTVERLNDVTWAEVDQGVDIALREHLLHCGGPVDGGLSDEAQSSLEKEVLAVLAERILPGVHRDGGDIELVGVSNGVAKVSMVGACKSCPASDATLRLGVERTLLDAFPGRIQRVEAV